ncbi:P-loop containing nucleoside triphosphate hydrolase protein [Annulohypoxylon truncatum]|uniref:P-loop containing nucleoside triphosphate hydrolase protein n=1 Tax=Annulohypoxylon truncatum TaxID=327061 RepID=UPI002008B4A2|nr:P-loop containing nucleoside triphosphate hydrolase protein [Annulohypoxylon truncatum]KAI1213214.1 P-loop containing nucleoside triphosphate hydrolase protein [Annulohypoxylon truncatum]
MAFLGASWSKVSRARLRTWRDSLKPLTVDIVGDFAGKERFAIHGEALVSHCISAARVDYGHGFQMLHAVHTIESFLKKLRDRGCNFEIVWFDSLKYLCIPYGTPEEHSYKYILTRAVLIQHFARQSPSHLSHRFDAVNCDEFGRYLTHNPLYFFMCSDGRAAHSDAHVTTLAHLSLGYHMSSLGYCVAFIDEISFGSSKVNISVATPTGRLPPIEKDHPLENGDQSTAILEKRSSVQQAICQHPDLTYRDIVTIYALSCVLDSSATDARRKGAMCVLIQLVILRHCNLSQRSFAQSGHGLVGTNHAIFKEFCEAAIEIADTGISEGLAATRWDGFDLVDGRLYLEIYNTASNLKLSGALRAEISELAISLEALTMVKIPDLLPSCLPDATESSPEKLNSRVDSSVLPFSHPVVDQYLQQVQLETQEDPDPPHSQIFQELTHWHNAKKLIDPKHVSRAPGFFARKRNQKFMADTLSYSASLTGASGKKIDPEIIVVRKFGEEKTAKSTDALKDDWRAALKKQASAKNRKKVPKRGVVSGKQKALEEAEATRMAKDEAKSLAAAESWKDRLQEFENERSLIKRFHKAERHLSGLSSAHKSYVNAEISLYICHILVLLRRTGQCPKQNVPDLEAILWSKVLATKSLPLTRDIASPLRLLSDNCGIPLNLGPLSSLPKRELPFTMIESELKSTTYSKPVNFQLDFCGPYMERSFDSTPDGRVPFYPDAWQRKVLDAIDADKSLFVVAPTSAGKTFISFYAMKKVLLANDDDVIVYVAPTKALVNQIAAEVQARFTKSYHGREGRSVWAIHTRDYRVNNPQGCQVLVTVPHVLQIMLLAPSNAKTPNSWSRRVKRIIFDEVHCIGQSEDGVIWEQLLLLAPCPIIALSATVGNPLEFKTWLEGTQRIKGYELDMIIHGSRYSDLRKYIYDAPPPWEFQGLNSVERLPFPGLESDADVSHRFAFVHPIGALVGRNPDTLNDASLEPRDCLSLWKCVKKYENDRRKFNSSLAPEKFLSTPVKKSDVVSWEASLKKELRAWLVDPESPFEAVQQELRGERYRTLSTTKSQQEPSAIAERQDHRKTIFQLAVDLRSCGALPAIFFNYDRVGCEALLKTILETLESAETKHKQNSAKWKGTIAEFERWRRIHSKAQGKAEKLLRGQQGKDDEGMSKADMMREMASQEQSPWASFDPDAPLSQFSFADTTKMTQAELDERLDTLRGHNIKPYLIRALRRGLAVHHAGMNRQYRQVVEMLFRKGYLTVVIATGTLALGINMPCKTVVFSDDSVFLTALNYRQASGRAGRRGFDVLGNVVFHGIPPKRALEIMSARLPDLRGQFPTSVTLVLRLFGLLHGTNNSEYASNAVKSLLTQTRLYLGGPAAQMSIEHHLRFSIDYLRRQQLLSEDGAPLNFSGLIGHLYFTENSVFAFHSLLKEGYFHNLCSTISYASEQPDVILEILLVLSHLFCRIPCYRYQDKSWLENAVHRSPSLVLLPALPQTAARVLKEHNRKTLSIFQNYVSTYASQHLSDKPDIQLPFTNHKIEPREPCNIRCTLSPLGETTVRSPFAALSGFTDEFETIGELCSTARSGVFLEESAIPYIPIAPDETNGVPWNAYLYDFFKHGDMGALVRDNGIKGGDVWFRLKDFSLILATIVTSLENFLDPNTEVDDAAMMDVQDVGDRMDENAGVDADTDGTEVETGQNDIAKGRTNKMAASRNKGKGKRKDVAESWDAESSDAEPDGESDDTENFRANATSPGPNRGRPSRFDDVKSSPNPSVPSWSRGGGESLVNVYRAFATLRDQFDEKFLKVWA